MKTRQFNAYLKQICTRNKIDINKIPLLSDEVRSGMVYHIVRNRCPILVQLIPENFDEKWLWAMGYLYKTKGKTYTFIHTCEQKIV